MHIPRIPSRPPLHTVHLIRNTSHCSLLHFKLPGDYTVTPDAAYRLREEALDSEIEWVRVAHILC